LGYNIKIDLRGVGWENVDWMHLARDRDQWRDYVNMVTNLRVPLKARNFVTSLVTISFTTRTLLRGVNSLVSWDKTIRHE
jgi:hypothetical protein